MAAKTRIFVALTPTAEQILGELVGGRLSPFKRATLASFALERGLMLMAYPTLMPEQVARVVP